MSRLFKHIRVLETAYRTVTQANGLLHPVQVLEQAP